MAYSPFSLQIFLLEPANITIIRPDREFYKEIPPKVEYSHITMHYDSSIKYLNEYRLFTAKNLITHTYRPISEISADVGYNQISHFIEQFRNSYGLSPLKYRNIA